MKVGFLPYHQYIPSASTGTVSQFPPQTPDPLFFFFGGSKLVRGGGMRAGEVGSFENLSLAYLQA